jgi:hypothetical protein
MFAAITVSPILARVRIWGRCLDVSEPGMRIEVSEAGTQTSRSKPIKSSSRVSATIKHVARQGSKYILGLELNQALRALTGIRELSIFREPDDLRNCYSDSIAVTPSRRTVGAVLIRLEYKMLEPIRWIMNTTELDQWIAFEHARLHNVEEWPESGRKRAVITAIRSSLVGLVATARHSSQSICCVCRSRKAGATVIPFSRPSRNERIEDRAA